MGTKNKPGRFDCYAEAHPDEPMFVLLGRDKHAPALVALWAWLRERDGEGQEKVGEALECAIDMAAWLAGQGKRVVPLPATEASTASEQVNAALKAHAPPWTPGWVPEGWTRGELLTFRGGGRVHSVWQAVLPELGRDEITAEMVGCVTFDSKDKAEVARVNAWLDWWYGPRPEGTWFALYGGTSADGRGYGVYIGRTTDRRVAFQHARACDRDPYSTGYVLAINPTFVGVVGPEDLMTKQLP